MLRLFFKVAKNAWTNDLKLFSYKVQQRLVYYLLKSEVFTVECTVVWNEV